MRTGQIRVKPRSFRRGEDVAWGGLVVRKFVTVPNLHGVADRGARRFRRGEFGAYHRLLGKVPRLAYFGFGFLSNLSGEFQLGAKRCRLFAMTAEAEGAHIGKVTFAAAFGDRQNVVRIP